MLAAASPSGHTAGTFRPGLAPHVANRDGIIREAWPLCLRPPPAVAQHKHVELPSSGERSLKNTPGGKIIWFRT